MFIAIDYTTMCDDYINRLELGLICEVFTDNILVAVDNRTEFGLYFLDFGICEYYTVMRIVPDSQMVTCSRVQQQIAAKQFLSYIVEEIQQGAKCSDLSGVLETDNITGLALVFADGIILVTFNNERISQEEKISITASITELFKCLNSLPLCVLEAAKNVEDKVFFIDEGLKQIAEEIEKAMIIVLSEDACGSDDALARWWEWQRKGYPTLGEQWL